MITVKAEKIMKQGIRDGLTPLKIQLELLRQGERIKYLSLARLLCAYSEEVFSEKDRAVAPTS